MKTICLYFEIHQIIHLKRYRCFDIGTDHYYYDDYDRYDRYYVYERPAPQVTVVYQNYDRYPPRRHHHDRHHYREVYRYGR